MQITERFNKLDKLPRLLVEHMAVYYAYIGTEDLNRLLQHSKYFPTDHLAEVNTLLERLLEDDILSYRIKDSKLRYSLRSFIKVALLLDLHETQGYKIAYFSRLFEELTLHTKPSLALWEAASHIVQNQESVFLSGGKWQNFTPTHKDNQEAWYDLAPLIFAYGDKIDIYPTLWQDFFFGMYYLRLGHEYQLQKVNLSEINSEFVTEQYSIFRSVLASTMIWKAKGSVVRVGDKPVDFEEVSFSSLLLGGKIKTAVEKGIRALGRQKLRQHHDDEYYPGTAGVLLIVSLIADDIDKHSPLIKQLINKGMELSDPLHREAFYMLDIYFQYRLTQKKKLLLTLETYIVPYPIFWLQILYFIILKWSGSLLLGQFIQEIEKLERELDASDYEWMQYEALALLKGLQELSPDRYEKYNFLKKRIGPGLTYLYTTKQPWEKALKALQSLDIKAIPSSEEQKTERIIWLYDEEGFVPKYQKRNKNGAWSSGRSVALRKLKEHVAPGMSEIDMEVGNCIEQEHYYYGGSVYSLNTAKALPYLSKHPYVYHINNSSVPLTIIKEHPQIEVIEKENGISIHTEYSRLDTYKLRKISPNKYVWYPKDPIQEQIITAFEGKNSMLFPPESERPLKNIIKSIEAYIPVISDLEARSLPEMDADPLAVFQITPKGEGFIVAKLMKPIGDSDLLYRPSSTKKRFIVEKENEKFVVLRDIKKENALWQNIFEYTPSLEELLLHDEIYVDDIQWALSIIKELRECPTPLHTEWPRGQKLRLGEKLESDALTLQLNSKNNWLEIDGALDLGEGRSIELKEVLDKLQNSPQGYIALDQGDYLLLSKELEKQLQSLDRISVEKEGQLKANTLSGLALYPFLSKINVESDQQWEHFVAQYEKAQNCVFEIPGSIQATLRPYQEEGFQWMAALAEWTTGACLADDMGLGKTLQAVTLLSHRVLDGPSLVIVPSSLIHNWHAEIERFATNLRPRLYQGTQRNEALEELKAGDVVIVSYGLLTTNIKDFAPVEWANIILDEAHAIKNIETKRTKAVMTLNGAFKLITTGTPLQNHLGELWTLFEFILPGLLGPFQQFEKKYIQHDDPLEGKRQLQHLKQLIAPFMMRRTKAQVLEDLPPKTEIVQHIELGEEERLLYDGLRIHALNELKDQEKHVKSRMKILAALTKLRLCCCHPALVEEDFEASSAKLEQLLSLLDRAIENRHRVLVFSQFTKSLGLIRTEIERRGWTYQYLDGSTSSSERKKRVEDFQNGLGELFLISLKAGGLGLNLTAADYVIHYDPWWNPAIEDQASDRAYRIGQLKPVTVYKLIAEKTIEEKIVALHNVKRELADDLLGGTGTGTKLSLDEIRALLEQ